jgi:hypothetical protein
MRIVPSRAEQPEGTAEKDVVEGMDVDGCNKDQQTHVERRKDINHRSSVLTESEDVHQENPEKT